MSEQDQRSQEETKGAGCPQDTNCQDETNGEEYHSDTGATEHKEIPIPKSHTKFLNTHWENSYFEATLHLTKHLTPKYQVASLHHHIKMMRLYDILYFKTMLRDFETVLLSEIANQSSTKILATRVESETNLMDEVLSGIGRRCTNYKANNDSSKSNKMNNGSRNKSKCNESVSSSSAIEQNNGNQFTNEKGNQTREVHYTNDRLTQDNSINMDHSSEIKIAKQANDRIKETSSYFTPRRKTKCEVCWQTHQIWKCQRLIRVCAKERTLLIQALRLCYKCLSKHGRGECQLKDCAHCGGPHHALLCYKEENRKMDQRSAKKLVTAEQFRSKASLHDKTGQGTTIRK